MVSCPVTIVPLVNVNSMDNWPDPSNNVRSQECLNPGEEKGHPVATFVVHAWTVESSHGWENNIKNQDDQALTLGDIYHRLCTASMIVLNFNTRLINNYNICHMLLLRKSWLWWVHRLHWLLRVTRRIHRRSLIGILIITRWAKILHEDKMIKLLIILQ